MAISGGFELGVGGDVWVGQREDTNGEHCSCDIELMVVSV